jgi:hypothetical protein
VVGEHAGSVDVELDLAVFRLGSVEAELAVDVLEGTGDEAVAQVADLEVERRAGLPCLLRSQQPLRWRTARQNRLPERPESFSTCFLFL